MRQAFRYLDGGRTLSTGSGSDKTLSWVMCAGRYFQNIESTDSAKGGKEFYGQNQGNGQVNAGLLAFLKLQSVRTSLEASCS